jgi:restriction endonuclease S subunit
MQMLNKKFLEKIEITIPSLDIQHKMINLKFLNDRELKILNRKTELSKLLIGLQLRKIINKI